MVRVGILAGSEGRRRGAAALARRLEGFDMLVASDLLEAELRCAFVREGVEQDPEMSGAIS